MKMMKFLSVILFFIVKLLLAADAIHQSVLVQNCVQLHQYSSWTKPERTRLCSPNFSTFRYRTGEVWSGGRGLGC